MKNIENNIIRDLTWLAEKSNDPIVKIAYGMAITIIEMHFKQMPKEPDVQGSDTTKMP